MRYYRQKKNSENSDNLSIQLNLVCEQISERIKQQLQSRAVRVANEMRNSEMLILRGQRSGRQYRVPHTGRVYTASAPGESPAVRTGAFRLSWQPSAVMENDKVISRLESNLTVNGYVLGGLLENGTSRMEPRPYKQKILDNVKLKALAIYNEPYV